MPEGPEVERVRRSLEPWVVGAAVTGVRVWRRDVIVAEGDPAGGVGRQRRKRGDGGDGGTEAARPRPVPRAALLVGDRVDRLERRGKQLAIIGASGRVALVHLGMTGRLVACSDTRGRREAHTHVGWTLSRPTGAVSMRFIDPRRFGGVWVLPSVEALAARWAGLGPDATAIGARELRNALEGSARSIKAALLDQRVVAGVGNIYADEALFEAGLAPGRQAGSLSAQETRRLAGAIRRVIDAAIRAGGSSIRDYVDADGVRGGAQLRHKVYGRGGKACVGCGGELAVDVVGQRTTVWCPNCQPRDHPGEGGRRT